MDFNRCYGCMQPKEEHPVCEHCGFNEETQNLPHQLPLGSILQGHYMIGRVLGQGGFGITYLGWDLYLEIPVAVKEYYPTSMVYRDSATTQSVINNNGDNEDLYTRSKERFLQEGKALAKFDELQNIVRIYNLFPENNTVYLVMEYA